MACLPFVVLFSCSVEYASSRMDSFVREFHSTMSSWSKEEFQAEVK